MRRPADIQPNRPVAPIDWAAAVASCALVLAGCPSAGTAGCGDDGGGRPCPTNFFCLFGQCEAPGNLSANLALLVFPGSPGLVQQQFLPVALNGSPQTSSTSTFDLLLNRPEQLVGTVRLPSNCPPKIAYPVHLHFEATSGGIASVPQSFDFDTDLQGSLGTADGQSGNVSSALLPTQTDYQMRVTTAIPCTAPIWRTFVAAAAGAYDVDAFVFDELPSLYRISGRLRALGRTVPSGALVRVLGQSANLGEAISATVPAIPVDAGGAAFQLAVDTMASPPVAIDGGCVPGMACPSQVSLLLDVFPASGTQTGLPRIELPIVATVGFDDAGPLLDLTSDGGVVLPVDLDPDALVTLTFQLFGLDGGGLAEAEVTLTTTADAGLDSCEPPTCSFGAQTYSSGTGLVTFTAPPGQYLATVHAPLPAGQALMPVTARADGSVVAKGVPFPPGVAIEIDVTPPFEISGLVVDPSNNPLSAGQVQLLRLPDLLPIASQLLVGGAFDLQAPKGSYLLLIQPDLRTHFPASFRTIEVQNGGLTFPSIALDTPGELAGQVQVPDLDSGLPIPVSGAQIQAFFLISDPHDSTPLAFPVAEAVTDSLGNWSAPGPPPK